MTNSGAWLVRLMVHPFNLCPAAGFGFQIPVNRLRRTGEFDKPIAFDGRVAATARWALATCSSMPRTVRRARSRRYW
jgi:hypothetical protein